MTRSAIPRVRMAARLHKLSNSSLMAALAGFGVASQRGGSVRRLVRIMATHAGERSIALHVASRFAQPVGGAGEFKPVFAFALVQFRSRQQAVARRINRLLTRAVPDQAWRAVEMQNVISERFARTIGEDATTVTQQARRKLQASGFEVALHADFHLPVERKPRGIDDRVAHPLRRRSLTGEFDMRQSGAVTSLAINSFRQPLRKSRASLPRVRLRLNLNITVVAGHAS